MHSLVRQRMGRSSSDVDDVLQDVFLQAWLHCETLREDSRCAGWLMRIAANTCATYLRRSERYPLYDELPVTEMEDVSIRVVARMMMEDAMARLTPTVQQAIWLHDLEGYPLKEIAYRMRKPEGTVKSALYRARATLRRLHAEPCGAVTAG